MPSLGAQADADERCAEPDSSNLLLHVPSPDWRDQVIYMIVTDRFNDADPSNNDFGAGEYNPDSPGHFNGGDIRGIEEKLGYLQNLGVSAIWVTPPVENQAWSSLYSAAGYHGYWAVHFKKLDPHFGTLDEYKSLSHALHCADMYLIQDVVLNHTANFFGYSGDYDPEDTAKNFVFYEAPDSAQPAPTMYPFNMIDRNNPEHVAMDIYHWTPPILDYGDPSQESHYQLGDLADINTENPFVIETLKDAFRYWIEEIGVDGFRVDTAKFVDHAFWNRFLYDADGIYPFARDLGKEHFLTFGEIFEGSLPFEDSAERKMLRFMGTDEAPELNSMLGFALYYEIDRVIAGGHPTAQLAHRLDVLMRLFPDPHVIPNFIDNHDTGRFLNSNSEAAFRQALAVISTVPGIPIIYQGTEQGLLWPRVSMFSRRWNGRDAFDQESHHFDFLRRLTSLTRENPALTRGAVQQVLSDDSGPGVFAFRRSYENESLLVVMNTADYQVFGGAIDSGFAPGTRLRTLFSEAFEGEVVTDRRGQIVLELPPRAVFVLAAGEPLENEPEGDGSGDLEIAIDQALGGQVYTSDFVLSGSVSEPFAELKLIRNGRLADAGLLQTDQEGRWSTDIKVRDLGESAHRLHVYAPSHGIVTQAFEYRARVDLPDILAEEVDERGDDHGPLGTYFGPTWMEPKRQRDIEKIVVRAAGSNLEITLTLGAVNNVWLAPNNFDNVAFTTFIDLPGRSGRSELPEMNAEMPEGGEWDLAHVGYGWGSFVYSAKDSDATRKGDRFAVTQKIRVDKASREITIRLEGQPLGVEDWHGSGFYVTTWDAGQGGGYLRMQPEGMRWGFGGGEPDDPKIMDAVSLRLPAEKPSQSQ